MKGYPDVKALLRGMGGLGKLPSTRKGKWFVLVFWVIAMAVLVPLAGKLAGAQDNQASSWLPGDAESTRALAITQQFRSIDETAAIVVYEKTGGITQADLGVIGGHVQQFATIEGVSGTVSGPILSTEQPLPQAAQVVIPLNVGGFDGASKLPDISQRMRDIATTGGDNLTVHITGPAGNLADQTNAFAGTDGMLLIAALIVVIAMLLLTYRSPILWLLPVISVGFALMAAQGLIYLLADGAGLTVNAQSAGILMVLVFGVGTDYALLLIARYREELRRHEDRHEAMAIALTRARPAIWASAMTVIAGMLCLLFAALNSTAGLGPIAAVGVAVGLLAMMTLLPALLVITGRWVFWPKRPAFGTADNVESGAWAKVGTAIARKPRLVWISATLVLVLLALGTLGLKADGITSAGAFVGKPDSVVGQEVLGEHFPAGAGQPVQVVAKAEKAAEVGAALSQVPGISSVTPPVVRDGEIYLEGTMRDAADSEAGIATLIQVRDAIHRIPGADALAGGASALQHDTAVANEHDRNLIIPLVLLVVFLILVGLLRSFLAPLLLIATTVLSFFAAMGISAFFFNNVLGFDGSDGAFPVLVFVFLVAVGIDYNIFLMTRVQEEAVVRGTRKGALIALSSTGGVITSAGLVLAGTFAVLGTLPLTSFAQLGFAVAVGVLIDTFIVRAVLVTGLTLDIGPKIWWPNKLASKPEPGPGPGPRESTPEPVLATHN
jgi:RND superfamily putative drug exporter